MLQPRHPGELELSRGAERDVQSFEIAASRILDGDPRIQGFVQRGTGFDGADLQRGRERRSERREGGHARGEPAHDVRPRRHGTPVRDTGVQPTCPSRLPAPDVLRLSRISVARAAGPFTFAALARICHQFPVANEGPHVSLASVRFVRNADQRFVSIRYALSRISHQVASEAVPTQMWSFASASAIWTLLSAAPLRTLSETIHMFSPRGQEMSSRIRPTNTASSPADSVAAVG